MTLGMCTSGFESLGGIREQGGRRGEAERALGVLGGAQRGIANCKQV